MSLLVLEVDARAHALRRPREGPARGLALCLTSQGGSDELGDELTPRLLLAFLQALQVAQNRRVEICT